MVYLLPKLNYNNLSELVITSFRFNELFHIHGYMDIWNAYISYAQQLLERFRL